MILEEGEAFVRSWQRKFNALWALLDQGAVSLTNFGLNFLLARFASPEVYGQFVVVFAVLLFVYSSIQVPLVLDPLIILGGKKDEEIRFVYVRRVLFLLLIISLVSAGGLFIGSVFLGIIQNQIYSRAFLLACLPVSFMNLRFFVRCFYIMKGEFVKAFVSDFSVLIIVILGGLGLIQWRTPTDWDTVTLLSVAEATPLFLLVSRRYGDLSRLIHGILTDVLSQPAVWQWREVQQNWNYGKWLLLANSATYIYQNIQFLLMPIFVPLASLAGYRACYLLAQPVYLFTTGLEAYAWNRSIELLRKGGLGLLQSFLWKMTWLISPLILLYILILGLSARWVLEILYAGKFGKFASLIWFFLCSSLLAFWGKVLGTGLRAIEATNGLFFGTLWAGVAGVVLFLIFTKLGGLIGAAGGYTFSHLLSVVLYFLYWQRNVRALCGVEVTK